MIVCANASMRLLRIYLCKCLHVCVCVGDCVYKVRWRDLPAFIISSSEFVCHVVLLFGLRGGR